MLNLNLDMDITDFITVGYAGLAEVIDGLGGIWIDVDEDEIQHINNYQYSILGKYAKTKYNIDIPSELNFTPDEYFTDYDLVVVDASGYQLLNGLQAAAYCRIRYVGNDFQRTERQREVLKAIESQAKQADFLRLISSKTSLWGLMDSAWCLTIWKSAWNGCISFCLATQHTKPATLSVKSMLRYKRMRGNIWGINL